jgi:hypothetical protein
VLTPKPLEIVERREELYLDGMRGGEDALVVEEVVCMEEAVNMLMEHLVRPALGGRAAQDEKERTIAQQVST